MTCEICGRGPAPEDGGITVHRQNKLGAVGIWRCLHHNTLPIDAGTQDIIDAVAELRMAERGTDNAD